VLQDSERTVSEAGAGETTILAEQPAIEFAHPTKVVTMVGHPAEDIARASAVLDMALVLASTSSPTGRLAEDVVLEFDATHHLSKLTTVWEGLSARAASFGELLQVGIFPCSFWWSGSFLFLLFLIFPLLCVKAFSRDQSSFFGLGEVERKLVFEVNQLKAKLACKQVELELEHRGR
jgi:hypothetical protein